MRPPPSCLPSHACSDTPTARATCWLKDPRLLPAMLRDNAPMHHRVNYLSGKDAVYCLEVSKAAVSLAEYPRFSAFLHSLLRGMDGTVMQVGKMGKAPRDKWWVRLNPDGPGFADLSRSLEHTGHYTVQWGDRQVTVPSSLRCPVVPPSAVQLKFLNVPPECSREGLPEAVLSLAGYTAVPATPGAPPRAPEAGSDLVVLLRYRLGGGDNAAAFVVDVIPPEDDPHLRRLPPCIRELSEPDEGQFFTFVQDDPLWHAPHPGYSPSPSPTADPPTCPTPSREAVPPANPGVAPLPAPSQATPCGSQEADECPRPGSVPLQAPLQAPAFAAVAATSTLADLLPERIDVSALALSTPAPPPLPPSARPSLPMLRLHNRFALLADAAEDELDSAAVVPPARRALPSKLSTHPPQAATGATAFAPQPPSPDTLPHPTPHAPRPSPLCPGVPPASTTSCPALPASQPGPSSISPVHNSTILPAAPPATAPTSTTPAAADASLSAPTGDQVTGPLLPVADHACQGDGMTRLPAVLPAVVLHVPAQPLAAMPAPSPALAQNDSNLPQPGPLGKPRGNESGAGTSRARVAAGRSCWC